MNGHDNSVQPDSISFTFRDRNSIYHNKGIKKILYYTPSLFFTGSCDSIIKLWSINPTSLNLVSNFEYHSNWITDLDLDYESQRLFSSSNDQSICIWDISNYSSVDEGHFFPLYTFSNIHQDYITSIKYNESTQSLFSSSLDGKIIKIDLESFVEQTIAKSLPSTYSIDVSQEGDLMLASLYSNEIALFDTREKGKIASLFGHNGLIRKVRMSPDGTSAISISSDKIIKLWDLSSQKAKASLDFHSSSITSLYVNKAFTKAITGGIDGEIYIIDLISQQFAKFDDIRGRVLDLALDEKETSIIACNESEIFLYDFSNEKEKKIQNTVPYIDTIELADNEQCDFGQKATIVKDEIVDYKLMNNKIYVIVKYSNQMGAVFNLMKMRMVPGSNTKTYDELVSILKEVDKTSLNSWCNIDIKLGTLSIILKENRCFQNEINNYNKNYLEDIIKKNFSINSSSKFVLADKSTKKGNDKQSDNESMSTVIDGNSNFTCGQYLFCTLIKKFLLSRIEVICENFYKQIKKEKIFKPINESKTDNEKGNNVYINYTDDTSTYSFYMKESFVSNSKSKDILDFKFPKFVVDSLTDDFFFNYNLIEKKSNNIQLTINFELISDSIREEMRTIIQSNFEKNVSIYQIKKEIMEKIIDITKLREKIKKESQLIQDFSIPNKKKFEKKFLSQKNVENIQIYECFFDFVDETEEVIFKVKPGLMISDLFNIFLLKKKKNILKVKYVPLEDAIDSLFN